MVNNNCNFYCYRNTRDIELYSTKGMDKLELVIFDMDGVLADIISSWKYIHDYFCCSNQKSVDLYLKGKIDDLEFIRRDISLWRENGKLIKEQKLKEILSSVPIMKGADKCVKTLKQNNIKTIIVSAGINILANRIAKTLGIDDVFANGIKTNENGRLSGEGILNVRLLYKDKAVKKISNRFNIPLERIATVGNSCFDIPMFETSGLGIAFNPRDDCTRQSANIIVESKDLIEILPHIGEYF